MFFCIVCCLSFFFFWWFFEDASTKQFSMCPVLLDAYSSFGNKNCWAEEEEEGPGEGALHWFLSLKMMKQVLPATVAVGQQQNRSLKKRLLKGETYPIPTGLHQAERCDPFGNPKSCLVRSKLHCLGLLGGVSFTCFSNRLRERRSQLTEHIFGKASNIEVDSK